MSNANRPARCRACGEFAYLSRWPAVSLHVGWEISLWSSLFFALYAQSWLALLLAPTVALLWSLVVLALAQPVVYPNDGGKFNFRRPSALVRRDGL